MKPLKVAAVLAGSLVVAGAASPAFAAENLTPSSLNGGIDEIARNGLRDPQQLLSTNAIDSEKPGSVVNAVKGATDAVNKSNAGKQLLGGLPAAG